MIPCTVERYYCSLLVTFGNGADLLLQTDYDQAAFCCNCGLIPTDDPLDLAFADCDPTTIEQCPDDYLALALETTHT